MIAKVLLGVCLALPLCAQIPSGAVTVVNLKSGTCLTMASVGAGAQAEIEKCVSGQATQSFDWVAVSGGYELQTEDGLAIGATGGSTKGSVVLVAEPFSLSNKYQIWTATAAATNGYYVLEPTSAKYCMATENGGTANGTLVWQAGCNSQSQQEWEFKSIANPVTVTAVSPNSGPTSGGTNIEISGTGFVAGATVGLGAIAATGVSVANSEEILATTPAGNAGAVGVSVTNPGATAASLANGFTYQAPSSSGTISYVQGNSVGPQTPQSSVPLAYAKAQTAGDLNVIVVGWNDSKATVKSVTDSLGNSYSLAVGPTVQSGYASQSIYYAPNIKTGSNTVTVQFSAAATYPDIRILEYSGANASTPIDVVATSSGTSTTSSTSAVSTNYADLLVAANLVQTSTKGPGSGFTQRLMTSPDGDIAEDEMTTQLGSYSASSPLTSSGPWIMQMVAIRPASSGGSTQPPPPTYSVNLSWTASTTSNVTYSMYRGTSASSLTQIASGISGTAWTDTTVSPGATYYYAATAVSSGEQSVDSNVVSVVVP